MISAKELRGKNSMLDRVQRQQDLAYSGNVETFKEVSLLKSLDKINLFSSVTPIRNITKAEIGNKRRLLR